MAHAEPPLGLVGPSGIIGFGPHRVGFPLLTSTSDELDVRAFDAHRKNCQDHERRDTELDQGSERGHSI
jgi:hypothetical protein